MQRAIKKKPIRFVTARGLTIDFKSLPFMTISITGLTPVGGRRSACPASSARPSRKC